MPTYTAQLQIQHPDGERRWEPAGDPEIVEYPAGAEDVAAIVAGRQRLLDGPGCRVAVWYGADADVARPPATACTLDAADARVLGVKAR